MRSSCPAAARGLSHGYGRISFALSVQHRCELTRPERRYKIYTMRFEFDPDKSGTNKQKHGIDFVRAQALWDDPDLIEVPARTTDEPRFIVIGRIGRRHWSAIITYRDDLIRIVSVRRSRPEEISIYEG